jgi:hypothetical protein
MSRENPPVDADANETDRTDATTSATDGTEGDATAPSTGVEHVESTVPGDRAAHRCPYCDRPFATEDRVTLHVGLTHYDVCSDAEAEAFEDAYVAETDAIKRYRLKAAAVLIVVYFGFLMVYAVFGVAG